MKLTVSALILSSAASAVNGFTFIPNSHHAPVRQNTHLNMGLFDGVKDAFSAPAMERSTLNAERETPIDRWMGWNAKNGNPDEPTESKAPANFVDSMDGKNYVTVELEKPMGIIFEENDEKYGGIFVLEIKEDGNASKNGNLKPGDQLIAVGDKSVTGEPFDNALGAIVDNPDEKTKLILFRGSPDMLYGPTGASKEWLSDFIASGGVVA